MKKTNRIYLVSIVFMTVFLLLGIVLPTALVSKSNQSSNIINQSSALQNMQANNSPGSRQLPFNPINIIPNRKTDNIIIKDTIQYSVPDLKNEPNENNHPGFFVSVIDNTDGDFSGVYYSSDVRINKFKLLIKGLARYRIISFINPHYKSMFYVAMYDIDGKESKYYLVNETDSSGKFNPVFTDVTGIDSAATITGIATYKGDNSNNSSPIVYISTNLGLYYTSGESDLNWSAFKSYNDPLHGRNCKIWSAKNNSFNTAFLEVYDSVPNPIYFMIRNGELDRVYFKDIKLSNHVTADINPSHVVPFFSANGTLFIGTNVGIYSNANNKTELTLIPATQNLNVTALSVIQSATLDQFLASVKKDSGTQTYYGTGTDSGQYQLTELKSVSSEISHVFWTKDQKGNYSAYIGTNAGLYQFNTDKFKTEFIDSIGQSEITEITPLYTSVPHFFVATKSGALYYSNQITYGANFKKDQDVTTPVVGMYHDNLDSKINISNNDMFLFTTKQFYASPTTDTLFSWTINELNIGIVQPVAHKLNKTGNPVFLFKQPKNISDYNIDLSVPILTSTLITYSYNDNSQISPITDQLKFNSLIKKYSYQHSDQPTMGLNKIIFTVKTPYTEAKQNNDSIQLVYYAWLTSDNPLSNVTFEISDQTKTLIDDPNIISNGAYADASKDQIVMTNSSQLILEFQDAVNPLNYDKSGYYKGTFDKDGTFSNKTNRTPLSPYSSKKTLSLDAGIYKLSLITTAGKTKDLFLEVGSVNQVIPYVNTFDQNNNPWTAVYNLAKKLNININIGLWLNPGNNLKPNTNGITISYLKQLLEQIETSYKAKITSTWNTWIGAQKSSNNGFPQPDPDTYLQYLDGTSFNNATVKTLIDTDETTFIKNLEKIQFNNIYKVLNNDIDNDINAEITGSIKTAQEYNLATGPQLLASIKLEDRNSMTLQEKCDAFNNFVTAYKSTYDDIMTSELKSLHNQIKDWLTWKTYEKNIAKGWKFSQNKIYLKQYVWSPKNIAKDVLNGKDSPFDESALKADYKAQVFAEYARENQGHNFYQSVAADIASAAQAVNLEINPEDIDTADKLSALDTSVNNYTAHITADIKNEAILFANTSSAISQWTLGYGTGFKFTFNNTDITTAFMNKIKYDPKIFINNPDDTNMIAQKQINHSALDSKVTELYKAQFIKQYSDPQSLLQNDISAAKNNPELKTALNGFEIQNVIDYYHVVDPKNCSQVETNYDNSKESFKQWLIDHAKMYWNYSVGVAVTQAKTLNISVSETDKPKTMTQLLKLQNDISAYRTSAVTYIVNGIDKATESMESWNLGYDFTFDDGTILNNIGKYLYTVNWNNNDFNPDTAAQNAINKNQLSSDVTAQYKKQFAKTHNNENPTQYLKAETDAAIADVDLYGNKLSDILAYYHATLPNNRDDLKNNYEGRNMSFQFWLETASYNYNNLFPHHHSTNSKKSDLVWIIPVVIAAVIVLAIGIIVWFKFFKLKTQKKAKIAPKTENNETSQE